MGLRNALRRLSAGSSETEGPRFGSISGHTAANSTIIQIYSHNVRLDASHPAPNERPWLVRRHGVVAAIVHAASQNPTLVGLQEVKNNQLKDILSLLGPDWGHYGVGREDGKTRGEYAPVLFKKLQWELLYGQTRWLSETPDRPSKGWDSAYERVVTLVDVVHRALGRRVRFFNTHYDHRGRKARIQSSLQIMGLMEESSGASFLAGDFNSEPHEEAYTTLSKGLVDLAAACVERAGFEFSDTGFDPGRKEKRIDFIWSLPGTAVLRHEIMSSQADDFLFSDHRPVVAMYRV